MFELNDTVLYGSHGVCKIVEMTTKEMCGQKIKYYVLKPVYESASTIFVPVNNERLTSKMRDVMHPEDIYSLVKSMPDEECEWVEPETLRVEQYKKILEKGNRRELVKLIKALYAHQQEQKDIGKKLHINDERLMKEAEKMLYDEFAYVLNIKREQVLPFIVRQIEVEEKN